MASKVMVKLPCTSFAQVNKPGSIKEGLVVTGGRNDNGNYHLEMQNGNKISRIAQLEQNIRFLQQQHQQMLDGLHKEIDNLRCRNRELLFHLIFTKGSVPSPLSTPDEDVESKVSPKNTIPLQVELLEKELTELKLQLQESENQNAYLSAIVEEQKKKLERYARERERDLERVSKPDPELLHKLDDAEALIRRLRRENSELRREQANIPTPSSNSSESYRQRDRGNYHNQRPGSTENKGNRHRNNGGGRSNYKGNWFPPLHTQSYWHGGRASDKGGDDGEAGTSFPNLTQGGGGGHYQNRRGSNNNRYNITDGRKYEGTPNKGKRRS
ncbi:coiled-coil domain-containing protein 92 [Agrilus planipennis]|uniref:Coiled-coil domain-containing protein 92 n=1 Tax=Agrilus planipennis TaxID=224129 RepID=A0A1W4XL55_AGRPL|nr:coiled-coil domain-containing protein 92 [Agrilus planipennis]